MKIRVVQLPSTSELLDRWYREHGHGSLPSGRDADETPGRFAVEYRNMRGAQHISNKERGPR